MIQLLKKVEGNSCLETGPKIQPQTSYHCKRVSAFLIDEKSIVERKIEYPKDRTETFDDYYLCMKA